MLLKDISIQRKLMAVNLLTSGAVLLLACVAFFAYEFHTFRQTTVRQLSTLGEIIATNSTAALAFDDPQAANEILAALNAEQHIVMATLYDTAGNLFAQYPEAFATDTLLSRAESEAYQYKETFLEGYQPVVQGNKRLGTLYLKSDLKAIEERFRLYGVIMLVVIAVASFLAYLLSNILQKGISKPILALAKTARAISERHDYSVRVSKTGKDELGMLTDAFNHMLRQIQEQNQTLNDFNKNLEQKVKERTVELEIAIHEQKEAEKEVYEKNKELSQALEELRSTEEQLIELNNELERRVEKRTEELRVNNEELEKTNTDLDNFIYTASHDLRSPIVNLEGLVIVLRSQLEDLNGTGENVVLDMVDRSIQKLKQTIGDLTEITKVQKDMENNAERLSFREMLDSVKEDIQSEIEKSKVYIKEEMEVTEILYSKNNLRSILYNLLSNAIKYRSLERQVEVTLKTYQENEYIVLSVADNGLGLNEKQQAKLFTMFKRLHSHVEGTGIGLYMIKRIVENRGGKIEVESKLNHGTTFKVYFLCQ
jgi:signal transduction histidine kinase/HAMP domain-containing protein